MKKILITGCAGFIGKNCFKFFLEKGYLVYGIDLRDNHYENCFNIDVLDYTSLEKLIYDIKPDIIVHLVGLKNLVECENNPKKAYRINYTSTENICNILKRNKITSHLIYVSSEYVFDGKTGNFKENDKPNPKIIYGKTKFKSEKFINKQLRKFTIVRTSCMLGLESGFLGFIKDQFKRDKPIKAYVNAIVSPTYIKYFLCCIEQVIDRNIYGILHISGKEFISRYDFAKKIVKTLNLKVNISKSSLPNNNLMAQNSTLNSEDSQKLLHCFNPSIDQALHDMVGNKLLPYFYYKDYRGIIIGISNKFKWEEVNFVKTLKGNVRGNHYHKNTIEGIYIIEGNVKVTYHDVKTDRRWEHYYKEGDFFLVYPYIIHTFLCEENSAWINLLTNKMSKVKDIQKIEQ